MTNRNTKMIRIRGIAALAISLLLLFCTFAVPAVAEDVTLDVLAQKRAEIARIETQLNGMNDSTPEPDKMKAMEDLHSLLTYFNGVVPEDGYFNGEDVKAECLAQLNQIASLFYKVRGLFNQFSEFYDDSTTTWQANYDGAEAGRQGCRTLIYQVTGNPFLGESDIEVTAVTQGQTTFSWQWNDQNIQQAGATRPTKDLRGTYDWDTLPPTVTDRYLGIYANVCEVDENGNPKTDAETLPLLWFYNQYCGFSWDYIYQHQEIMARASSAMTVPDSHGGATTVVWDAGNLISNFRKDGKEYKVSYSLAYEKDGTYENSEIFGEIPGYQITYRNEGDTQNVLITPTVDFTGNVIWYDNHNTYIDPAGGTYRPEPNKEELFASTASETGDKLYTLNRVYTDDDGKLVTETVQVTADMYELTNEPGGVLADGIRDPADRWTIYFPELPKYSESGKLYTYHLVQNEKKLENLNGTTGGRGEEGEENKGTYYSAQVNNPALVEIGHQNCIHDQGTVTNTLSYNGSILINKEWIDGGRDPSERPKTTMYFYRVAEPDALANELNEIDGSPVPGYDKLENIQTLPAVNSGNPGDGTGENPGEGTGDGTGENSGEGSGGDSGGTGTQGQAQGEYVKISVPQNDAEWLPIFDNYGRRYIYYAVEMMDGQGDYQVRINNQGVSISDKNKEDRDKLIAMADDQQLILNGATVTNVLEANQRVPVTVDFKAQAIQNAMDGATVELQLQYLDRETGEWTSYTEGEHEGKLTLDSFQAEAMTVTGYSDPVRKYDVDGYPVEYRWVQTNMTVNNGKPVKDLPDDKPTDTEATLKDNGNEVGPGVDDDKTTERFDIKYSTDKDGHTVITNTLVGDTQIEVTKKWTYTLDNGETYTYSSDGGNWDGTWESLRNKGVDVPAGAIEPASATLTYNVYRNGVQYTKDGEPVTITMEGVTEETLGGLPRYDENGNEYTYTTTEQEVNGWGRDWDYTVTVEDDAKGKTGDDGKVFRVTQLNAGFNNFIGPGNVLYFDITKEWEDDTDIQTRRPVQVAVFTLGGGKVANTDRTLDLVNLWHTRVSFEAPVGDEVSDYVVKEISVGSPDAIKVQYKIEDNETLRETAVAFYDYIKNTLNESDPFAEHKYAQPELDKYRVGDLAIGETDEAGVLEYFYHVYMSASETDGNHASYIIYNQRYGDVVIDLTKQWINGAEHAAARFVVEQKQKQKDVDGQEVWVRIPVGEDADHNPVYTFELNSRDADVDENGNKKQVWNSHDNDVYLPKYDAQGVHYEYRIVETEMALVDENGNTINWIPIAGGVASLAGSNTQLNADRYVCTVSSNGVDYQQAAWKDKEDDEKGPSPHNSGDVYYWNSVNRRADSYPISIYKVWRDGGGQYNKLDSASRPDITFQLYRVSYAELRAENPTLENAEPEELIRFVRDQDDVTAFTKKAYVHHVSDHKLWSTSDNPTTDAERVEHNYWLWYCKLAGNVDKYDTKTGSRYIYFCVEKMNGNSHNYQTSYDNLTEDRREELAKSGYMVDANKGYNTETTYQEGDGKLDQNLLIIYDGLHDEDYYSRIVVNTRQNEADVDVKKVWEIDDYQMYVGGKGIPLSEMPPVTLHLWRDVGEMTEGKEGDEAEKRFIQAAFSQAQRIDTIVLQGSDTISFPSEEYKAAHAGELVEVNGVLKLPRYNEYGYRYSYWITEEPIHSYTSGSMGNVQTDANGAVSDVPETFNPEADIFRVENRFVVQPPYVALELFKTWDWSGFSLENIPDDKKNFTVTFELHAVMVDASGKPIKSEDLADVVIATQNITVKDGKPQPTSAGVLNPVTITDATGLTAKLSFQHATDGGFANAMPQLPYWAPNGRPFRYYVVEKGPDGYTATSEVRTNDQVKVQKEEGKYGDTGLIQLIRSDDQADDVPSKAEIVYTNTYNGDSFRSLLLQKNWIDETELHGNPKPPESVYVKLYRAWIVGDGQYGVEQVTMPDQKDVSVNWAAADNGTFEIKKSEYINNNAELKYKWELKLEDGLYRLAPNGNPYIYFFVEQGEYADEPNTDGIPGYNGYYAELSTDSFPDRDTLAELERLPTGKSYIEVSERKLAWQRGYSNAVWLPENADDPVATLTAANDRLYKTVKYTKIWKKEDAESHALSSLTDDDVKMLVALGVLPEQMTFAVQYRMNNDMSWQLLRSYSYDGDLLSTDDWEEALQQNYAPMPAEGSGTLGYKDFIASNGKIEGSYKLPAYAKDYYSSNLIEVDYRVVERMVFADDKKIVYYGPEDGAGNVSSPEHSDFTIDRDEDRTAGTLPNKQTITDDFTNTIKTKDLVLRKIWVGDNANRDDTRPDSIKILLEMKNSDSTLASFEVELKRSNIAEVVGYDKGNVYQKTYSVLASLLQSEYDDKDGNPTSLHGFEVTEVAPEGDDTYEWWDKPLALEEIKNDEDEVVRYEFSATNTLENPTRKTIDLTATKTWANEVTWDENTRPAQIRFTLEYQYESRNDEGTVTWSDWATATNKDTGVQRADITLKNLGDSNHPNSDSDSIEREATWENLFQYFDEDGSAIPRNIRYRVKEEMLDTFGNVITRSYRMPHPFGNAGYSDGVDATDAITTGDKKEIGIALTNTLNKTSVSVKKLWKYSNGNSLNNVSEMINKGILPSHVQFTLYYRVKKTTGPENAWYASNKIAPAIVSVEEKLLGNDPYTVFPDLPMYNSRGEELEYKLEETGVCYNGQTNNVVANSKSFAVEYADGADGTTVTNTLTVGSLTVTKSWEDMDDRDGVRPTEIAVQLSRDGAVYATETLNAGNNWTYTWNDLPVYQQNGTTPFKYSVAEGVIKTVTTDDGEQAEFIPGPTEGYTLTAPDGLEVKLANGDRTITLTNKHEPETIDVSATKQWVDNDNQNGVRPASVTFRLEYRLDDNADWEAVTYKQTGFTGKSDVSFSSITDGNLNKNGTVTIEGVGDDWDTVTWNDLPKYAWNATESVEVQYRVVEVNGSQAYTTNAPVRVQDSATPVTVINTLKTTNLTARKVWAGDDGHTNYRKAVTFKLMYHTGDERWKDFERGGKIYEEVLKENNWTAVFENLPTHTANGLEYHYKVVETSAPGGYTNGSGESVAVKENGSLQATITNKFDTVDISAEKIWNDGENRDGLRPGSITFILLADGTKVEGKDVTVTEREQWKCTFANLPKYNLDGSEIAYTVEEEEEDVPDYDMTAGSEANGYKVINDYQPKTISISATKQWEDNDNQNGVRPASVTFQLQYSLGGEKWSNVPYAPNGLTGSDKVFFTSVAGVNAGSWTEIGTATLTGEGTAKTWGTVTWSGLPKYARTATESVEVQYQVVELNGSKRYDTTSTQAEAQDGAISVTVTNALKTTDVSAQKVWKNSTSDDDYSDDEIKALIGKHILPSHVRFALYERVAAATGQENPWVLSQLRKPVFVRVEDLFDSSKDSFEAFKGLPQCNDNGETIEYRLMEIGVYFAENAGDEAETESSRYHAAELDTDDPTASGSIGSSFTIGRNGTTIINTLATVDISVNKDWNDGENRDGLRPDSIVLKLMVGSKVIATQTVSAQDQWACAFKGLPKYDENGQPIAYTVEEEGVTGYLTTTTGSMETGYTVTNTLSTQIPGEKTWNDGDNRDGLRPESITINLKGVGTNGYTFNDSKTVRADADGSWKYTFANLPKYDPAGQEIHYSVTEEGVESYAHNIVGFNVTNTHTPEKTTFAVSKKWDDQGNLNGLRPESVTFQLKYSLDGRTWDMVLCNPQGFTDSSEVSYSHVAAANGQVITEGTSADVTLKGSGDTWGPLTWYDLPVYVRRGGTTYRVQYQVDEVEVPQNYSSNPSEDGHTVTNTLQMTSVKVTKSWMDDDAYQDEYRPDEVTVALLYQTKDEGDVWHEFIRDGEPYTAKLKADEDEAKSWTAEFTSLPEKEADGTDYCYKVEEMPVTAYSTEITGSAEAGYTVTNTLETVELEGRKAWLDGENQERPAEITIRLKANGEEVDNVRVTEDDGWSWNFTGKPKYAPNGDEITYTVSEDPVEGYAATIAGSTVTNVQLTSIPVTKSWEDGEDKEGVRPQKITVTLKRDGQEILSAELNAENGWTHTFDDLPKYDADDKAIAYTVEETPVAGYSTEISGSAEAGYTITNTLMDRTISVTKVWDDEDNRAGQRPAEITITLKRDGVADQTATLNSQNDWHHEFTGLLKYDRDGREIAYTVEESRVEGYTGQTTGDMENGFTVTNKPVKPVQPEDPTIPYTFQKIWRDGGRAERPTSITFRIERPDDPNYVDINNRVGVSDAGVRVDGDTWTWAQSLNPKYTYTVTEVNVPAGYISECVVDDETHTVTITNTYVPPTGDNSHLSWYVAALCVSLAGMLALYAGRKKKTR